MRLLFSAAHWLPLEGKLSAARLTDEVSLNCGTSRLQYYCRERACPFRFETKRSAKRQPELKNPGCLFCIWRGRCTRATPQSPSVTAPLTQGSQCRCCGNRGTRNRQDKFPIRCVGAYDSPSTVIFRPLSFMVDLPASLLPHSVPSEKYTLYKYSSPFFTLSSMN